MSTVSWNKTTLSPGAVAGIAVGGAVILSIPIVIVVVMFLRARRRRMAETSQQRWSIYPGGHVSSSDRSYSQTAEANKSGRRNAFILQKPYARRLPLPSWHDPAPHHQSLLNGSDEKLEPEPKATNDKTDTMDNAARLSWPLRSQITSQALFSTWHINMMRLSPIAESPLSRSQSSPNLPSPFFDSPRLPRPAFLSFKRPLRSLASANGPHWWSNEAAQTADRRTPNVLRKRPRVESSWRLDRSTSSRQLSKSDSGGSKRSDDHPTRDSSRARPESSTLPPSQSPPIRPEELSPVPMQQLTIPGQILRVVNPTDGEKRDFSGSSASKTPTALNKHEAHDLAGEKTDAEQPWAGKVSNEDGHDSLKSTPRSSRTSDDLSMLDDQAMDWETPPVTGLHSPSRNKKRRHSKVTPHTSSSKKSRQTGDAPSGIIKDDSRVSLSTLGAHRRGGSTEEDAKESPADRILLTPSSNPMTFSQLLHAGGLTPTRSEPLRKQSQTRSKSAALRDISCNGGDSPVLKPYYNQPLFPSKTTPDTTAWNSRAGSIISPPISAIKGKGRQQGHKRQNCVRISTLIPVEFSAPPSRNSLVEEPTKLHTIPQTPPSSSLSVSDPRNRPLPQPPSSATFEPQLSPLHGKGNDKENWSKAQPRAGSHRTKSASKMPNPAREMLAPVRANTTTNRFSTGSSIFSEPCTGFSRPNSVASEAQQPTSSPAKMLSATSTVLDALKKGPPAEPDPSPFNVSPLRIPPRSPKRPANFIRGPRTPPSRRRSPQRTPPSQDVYRSVVALRRMNSDLSVARSNSGNSTGGRSKSTSLYLNLRQPRSAPFERRSNPHEGPDPILRSYRSSFTVSSADDNGSPTMKKVKFEISPLLDARGLKKSASKDHSIGVALGGESRDLAARSIPDPQKRHKTGGGVVGLGLSFGASADRDLYDQAGFLIS